MENPTLAQGNEITNLILRNKVSKETIQFLLTSGMMANLFKLRLENFLQDGNANDSACRIAQARYLMSLGLLPEFEVVNQYYLDTIDPNPVPSRSLIRMFEERGVKTVIDETRKHLKIITPGHQVKPRSAEFSLIRFPVLSREDRPGFAYNPAVILNAAGYLNADVYDLVAFSTVSNLHIVTNTPVVALKSVVQTSTSFTGGSFIYNAHPTLHCDDMQKGEVWFNKSGLKDMDFWTSDYLCLVRNRDTLARSPKI